MRLVTWNCGGGFRKKFAAVSALNADIYVIQECEDPGSSNSGDLVKWAENYQWVGDNPRRGLGIFARNGHVVNLNASWKSVYSEPRLADPARREHRVKYFLPCVVDNKFNLCGVWTHKSDAHNFPYMGQFWKYLQINRSEFRNVLVAGDFNSNSRWDQWDRWWNHSDVVRELRDLEVHSLYHEFTGEKQGNEKSPTFRFRRNKQNYHIDYVFGTENFLRSLKDFAIGDENVWYQHSDHLPLIADFKKLG